MLPREIPVLVVGAGPSGLMTAVLLERMGIETLVVERRCGPQRAPAAHVVNARTFEICRAAGVDMQGVARAALAPRDAGFVDWVTKLGGTRLGRLPFERQGDDQLDLTPTPLRNLSQNRFEPLLVDALGVPPRWRCEWESAQPDGDGVLVRVRQRDGGGQQEIRCRYLLAADGAGSRVRRSLGIGVQGPERVQSFVMIHLRAALRERVGDPPSVLSFVADPLHAGVFVIHDPDREATFMAAFDADRESVADYDEARCAAIVRGALERPDLDFEVETISTWHMTAQVAERYREGRVFLVGDAAHRFPPTGGLGLNTGVQDAHALAWRLAFVLQGLAGERLLDGYEAERRPVAQHNAAQSLTNALRLLEVPQVLGITDASEASRAAMQRTLADAGGRARVAAAIERQAEHFDMPGLQLGFSYAAGAGPPAPRRYEPSGEPGRRLPHAWFEGDAAQRSLLDEVPLDRFLLLAGPDATGWLDAAKALASPCLLARRVPAERMHAPELWLARAGIAPSGALLVRPDQHVAWRARGAGEAAELREALAHALSGARPGERVARAAPPRRPARAAPAID